MTLDSSMKAMDSREVPIEGYGRDPIKRTTPGRCVGEELSF